MNGQWIGAYTGTTVGVLIANIDERTSHYEGVAYLLEGNKDAPSTAAFFRTRDKKIPFELATDLIMPIDPATSLTGLWANVKNHYPEGTVISTVANVSGSMEGASLSVSWTTDIGATGKCVLPRSKASEPSPLIPQEKSWTEYKAYVEGLSGLRYLFRGQDRPWRLRTSFHRSGRADLTRFVREDVQVLYKHLSARTRHVFNLGIPDENGAFYNLIQHHGYPTPLLDWTYSPYVAAFFAYRGVSSRSAVLASPNDKVRILVLDQHAWRQDWNQVLQLLATGFHFSIGEFVAIENERMIPQQAASTLTNLDDIEGYIQSKENQSGKIYLSAIDLPLNQRDLVVQELAYMGITAGSMFPGLDGACEELRERNFRI